MPGYPPYLQATHEPLKKAAPSPGSGSSTQDKGKVAFGWVAVSMLTLIILLTCYCTHRSMNFPTIKSAAISDDAFMAQTLIQENSEELPPPSEADTNAVSMDAL